MDYYTLKKLFDDLKGSLKRARLQKVFGSERGISLKLRGAESCFLNFVVSPVDDACFFKSEEPFFDGDSHFSQFLNNLLKSSMIVDFSEVEGERVFSFIFEKKDFAKGLRRFILTLHIVGKKVMLSLKEGERILDFMGHDLTEIGGNREQKFLWDAEREEILEAISVSGVEVLSRKFYPVPKVLLKEVIERTGNKSMYSPEELISFWNTFLSLKKELFSSSLWLFHTKDTLKIYPFKPVSLKCLEYSNPQKAIFEYLKIKREVSKFSSKRASLIAVVKKQLKNVQKLKGTCVRELKNAGFEKYRLWAEAILVNLNKISVHEDKIVLPNPYNEKELLEIPYECGKKPSSVAQALFQKYSKLKKRYQVLKERIESLKLEEMFLEEVLWHIEEAESLKELEGIEELLQEQGYIRRREVSKTKTRYHPYRHLRWKSFDIYVGKNSRGNEFVTFKIGAKDDLWFHVKDYPGAHVIVKVSGKEVLPEDLGVAAAIAAYFSKAKFSSKVDVDYTKVKYVSKIKGAAPGMVIYRNYRTLTVKPHIPEGVEYVEEG